jgi:predicted aspartyl protease
VKAYVNGYKLNLLLDTGATNTVIDYNILLMSDIDYRLVETQQLMFETASGVINAQWVNVDSFISLGIHNVDFNFATYDSFVGRDYSRI